MIQKKFLFLFFVSYPVFATEMLKHQEDEESGLFDDYDHVEIPVTKSPSDLSVLSEEGMVVDGYALVSRNTEKALPLQKMEEGLLGPVMVQEPVIDSLARMRTPSPSLFSERQNEKSSSLSPDLERGLEPSNMFVITREPCKYYSLAVDPYDLQVKNEQELRMLIEAMRIIGCTLS